MILLIALEKHISRKFKMPDNTVTPPSSQASSESTKLVSGVKPPNAFTLGSNLLDNWKIFKGTARFRNLLLKISDFQNRSTFSFIHRFGSN